MSVDEKAGTESIPVVDELEIRLGSLAPIYAGRKPESGLRFPDQRLLLHPSGEWCIMQDYWHATIMSDKELDQYSNNSRYKMFFAFKNEKDTLEFHLYEKTARKSPDNSQQQPL